MSSVRVWSEFNKPQFLKRVSTLSCNLRPKSRGNSCRTRLRVFPSARCMRELCQQPHDGVLLLMGKLLARARKARQCAALEVPRLMPALQRRLQKTEASMRAGIDRDTWLPEAREAKLSPMEYMDRCNQFLCKLDTMGWKRSFHQNLFHAASGRALARSARKRCRRTQLSAPATRGN